MTATELLAIAEDVLPEVLGNGPDRSRSTRLGLALGRKRGRVFAALRLQEVETTDDYSRTRTAWGLVSVASETRRGGVERADVGAQAVVAQDPWPSDPNVRVGAEKGFGIASVRSIIRIPTLQTSRRHRSLETEPYHSLRLGYLSSAVWLNRE